MEERVFIQQVNQCHGLIIKLINMYAYSTQDRKDIYQEILLNAWNGIANFRQEAKFSTWLYQVALNTIFTMNRKTKKVIYHDSLEEFVIPVSPQADTNEDIRHLYAAIRKLAETDRAIIVMHLEGYSNTEISDILGITANNIGVKIFRIKNQLQTFLKAL